MSLGSWVKGLWIKGQAGQIRDQAEKSEGGIIKSVLTFLSGWKSWILACVLLYKILCHDCRGAGYIVAVVRGLGWDTDAAAFDPAQAAEGLVVVWALGHHLYKAVKQYRAGVPLKYVHTDTGALIAEDAAHIKELSISEAEKKILIKEAVVAVVEEKKS